MRFSDLGDEMSKYLGCAELTRVGSAFLIGGTTFRPRDVLGVFSRLLDFPLPDLELTTEFVCPHPCPLDLPTIFGGRFLGLHLRLAMNRSACPMNFSGDESENCILVLIAKAGEHGLSERSDIFTDPR